MNQSHTRADLRLVMRRLEEDGLLDRRQATVIARAPGRLDLMGGIADYSGALVLQMPIAEAAFAAVQRDDEPVIQVVSGARQYQIALSALTAMTSYNAARAHFAQAGDDHWAAYVIGVVVVLMREKNLRLAHGLRLWIDSQVPEGKGVSSSAAIEIATMQAVAHLLKLDLPPVELATLCQKVENQVVGAPCGIMDQMASACGREGKLLALLCQPAEIRGYVDLPAALGVWGIDSGIRHAVSGADYATVRAAAFMGRRMLEHADATLTPTYLADVAPSVLASLIERIPASMSGEAFLDRFGETGDTVTRVDPARTYPVRSATAHPIGEHHRIQCFAKLLHGPLDDETAKLLGEMMYQSHASYSACGLGSEGTDQLVTLVREAGPAAGLFGAKITGGGSGGTVAILGRADAADAVRSIAQRYADHSGREPYIFEGSSPGAAEFGTVTIPAQGSASAP